MLMFVLSFTVYHSKEQIPVVWPSFEAEVKRIISKYKQRQKFDQSERRVDQKFYLLQCIKKISEKLMRLQKKN